MSKALQTFPDALGDTRPACPSESWLLHSKAYFSSRLSVGEESCSLLMTIYKFQFLSSLTIISFWRGYLGWDSIVFEQITWIHVFRAFLFFSLLTLFLRRFFGWSGIYITYLMSEARFMTTNHFDGGIEASWVAGSAIFPSSNAVPLWIANLSYSFLFLHLILCRRRSHSHDNTSTLPFNFGPGSQSSGSGCSLSHERKLWR